MKKKVLCGVLSLNLILGVFTGCGDTKEVSDTFNNIEDTSSAAMEEPAASEVSVVESIQETLDEPAESEEAEEVLYTVSNLEIHDYINNFVSVIQRVESKQYAFGDRCIDTLLESTAQSVNDSTLLNIRESDPRIILTQDLYDKEDSELDSFIYSASDSLAFGSPWDSRILASNINHAFSYYEDTDAKIYMIVNFGTYQDFDYSVNFDDSYCYVTIDSRHTYNIKKDYIYDIVDGYVNFDYYHYFDDCGDCSNGIGNFENVIAEDEGARFMFSLYDFRPWYFELVCSSDDPTRWLINDVHCLFDDSFESPYDNHYLNYFSGYINDCMYEKGKYYDLLTNKLVNEGEPEKESSETVDVPEDWKQIFLNSEDFMEYNNNDIDYNYILLDITDDGVPELFIEDIGWGKMILLNLDDNYTVVSQGVLGEFDTVGFSENYLFGESGMSGISVEKINKGTSTFTNCPLNEINGNFYDPNNPENIIEWNWDSLTYIYELGLTSTAQQTLEDAILNYNN